MRDSSLSFLLRSAVLAVVVSAPLGMTGCGKKSEPTPALPAPVVANQPTGEPSKPYQPAPAVPDEKKAAADSERALAVIGQLGGKVEHDPNLPNQPVTEVDLRGTKLSDEGLAQLRALKHLRVLLLGGDNTITDTGLAQLADLSSLTEITVNEGGGHITDAGLAKLKSLKKIIFGAYSKVTGTGLVGLTSLEHLDAAYSSADDLAVEKIGTLKNLRFLRLDHNHFITDAGLQHLKGLTQLENLGLYNVSKTTDRGLGALHDLKNLKQLLLNETQVTDQGVKQFQEAVPGCTVTRK